MGNNTNIKNMIFAPENACSGAADWTQFEEVWQYGSNNNPGDPNRDPLKQQDGIAPQCAVLGIDPPIQNVRGRAYIPSYVTTKGFKGSHSIDNYGWVIN